MVSHTKRKEVSHLAISARQRVAIEALTSGEGLTLKEVAERAGVAPKTLWGWRNENTEFIAELKKINDERWQAAVDAARTSTIRLCKEGNQKMIEFVLKNEGYNPTNKVEAEITQDIVINIEE